MSQWWNHPAPGEGRSVEIDPETGQVSEHYREHLWLAPFRGVLDLISDAWTGRLSAADIVFLGVLVFLIAGRG